MCYDEVNVFTQKLQEIGVTISSKMYKSLNPHNFLIIYCNIFKMMKIYMFLNLILYRTFQNENILPTNMFYDQMDVFIQNL